MITLLRGSSYCVRGNKNYEIDFVMTLQRMITYDNLILLAEQRTRTQCLERVWINLLLESPCVALGRTEISPVPRPVGAFASVRLHPHAI